MKIGLSTLVALSILVFVGIGCSWLPTVIGDRGKHVPSYALSPDGKQIAISANDGDLYLVDLDSKKVTRLTETPAYEKRPSFSPDGKSLVYVSEPSGDKFSSRVFRMQIDTREVTQLTKDSGICDNNPHYSRDGLRIVFARASRNNGDPYVRDLWNDYDLYVMNADGSGQKRITNGLYQRELDGRFSVDGANLIFNGTVFSGASGKSEMLEIKADGNDKGPAVIIPGTRAKSKYGNGEETVELGGPDLSPDGRIVIYRSNFDMIRLFDLTAKAATDLNFKEPVGDSVSLYDPVFAPDGKRAFVLVSIFRDASKSDYSLWSVDISGKEQKEIADPTLFADPLSWKPKN